MIFIKTDYHFFPQTNTTNRGEKPADQTTNYQLTSGKIMSKVSLSLFYLIIIFGCCCQLLLSPVQTRIFRWGLYNRLYNDILTTLASH